MDEDMGWEDMVFLIGNFGFALSLLPTILDPNAVIPPATSGLTAAILLAYVAAFTSWKRPIPALGTLLSVAAWAFILLFRNGM